MQSIGDTLRVLGISQAELAGLLAVRPRAVSYWVTGGRRQSRRARRHLSLMLTGLLFERGRLHCRCCRKALEYGA